MIAAMLLSAVAGAGGADVGMTGQAFVPGRVTVLVGEEVTWTNRDDATHTATAADRSFDSRPVAPGGAYSRRFDAPGEIAYRCSLHRFMRGTVEVVAVALEPPPKPVAAGEPAELTGRVPHPGTTVVLERVGSGPVAATTADHEGGFRFRVDTTAGPAAYRARSGSLSSAVAQVAVAPQVRLAARRGRRGVSLRVHVVPPQPGAIVVLERHERERFGYVRLLRRGVRLDASSRARVYVATHRRLRLRARLSATVGGYSRAVSGVVVVPRTGVSREDGHH